MRANHTACLTRKPKGACSSWPAPSCGALPGSSPERPSLMPGRSKRGDPCSHSDAAFAALVLATPSAVWSDASKVTYSKSAFRRAWRDRRASRAEPQMEVVETTGTSVRLRSVGVVGRCSQMGDWFRYPDVLVRKLTTILQQYCTISCHMTT